MHCIYKAPPSLDLKHTATCELAGKDIINGNMALIVLLVFLASIRCYTCEKEKNLHDYCIIGAGPSGLQLGYLLHKAHRDYIIFERSNISGKAVCECMYTPQWYLIEVNT